MKPEYPDIFLHYPDVSAHKTGKPAANSSPKTEFTGFAEKNI